MATLRTHHPLVGTPLIDLEQLRAQATRELCEVLDHACVLARRRLAHALAVERALAAYEAPPFFESDPLARPRLTEQLCTTDLVRALLAGHARLWACFRGVASAHVDELAQRWSCVPEVHAPAIALHPALARRLTWANTLEPLRAPEQLFASLGVEAAAALADHQELFTEGLITRSESIWRLMVDADPAPRWLMPLPEPFIDLGQLAPLCDALLAGSRERPIVIVRGATGSGRTMLARQALLDLRRHAAFAGWGFNLDNYHGGELDFVDAPALLALSDRCVGSYGTEDVELATRLTRSVLHRPEDARLILRVESSTHGELVQRVPELALAPVIDMPKLGLRDRAALLLAHMVVLDDWFGVDWGLPEALALARQTEALEPIALILACADRALARTSHGPLRELASARSNRALPEDWELQCSVAASHHARAAGIVAAPTWRSVSDGRSRALARRFERERPEDHAALRELAATLHLRV